jgi:hypothetical protein
MIKLNHLHFKMLNQLCCLKKKSNTRFNISLIYVMTKIMLMQLRVHHYDMLFTKPLFKLFTPHIGTVSDYQKKIEVPEYA